MAQEVKEIDYTNNIYLVTRLVKEYIIPHTKTFLISIALMLVIAGTTSIHAWLVKPALDEVFVKKNTTMLVIIPVAILLITIVKGFATYFQLLTMGIINMRITADMRKRLYAHFIKSDIADLHSTSSGEMIGKIMGEIGSIVGAISTAINGFVKQLFTLVFLVVVMFNQSLELSLVAFIGFPLAAYPIYKLGKKLRNLSSINQSASQRFISQMDDTLQYSKLVKAYHCEDFEIRRMANVIEHMFKIGKKVTRISLIASPFVEALGGVGVAAVIWYGGHQVLSGQTTPGAFFSFFAAMLMAYRPLKSVSGMNSGIQVGLGAAERLYMLLDKKPLIIDRPGAKELKDVKGNIKFKDVHFHYIKDKTALNGISFEVPAGKTVALVGHSGGGKSTIMSMLLRFYDPQKGHIEIDGHRIDEVTIKSLRTSMSVVNQEVMLFDDTILENIRYGKEDATKEEIINAAKMAEADGFINELPNGYDTQIGQNGIRLSGGQRQRVAIARAILYNAPILLLDEATSSLDPVTEKQVRESLKFLTKDKTTIIIAHKLSTLLDVDRILVFDNGAIIEDGSHAELLKKNGHYAFLWSMQHDGLLPDGNKKRRRSKSI